MIVQQRTHVFVVKAVPVLDLQAPRLNNRDRKAAARAAQALRLQDTHQTILADLNVISNFFEPDQAIETSLPDFAKTSPAVRSAVSWKCAGAEQLLLPSPPSSLHL